MYSDVYSAGALISYNELYLSIKFLVNENLNASFNSKRKTDCRFGFSSPCLVNSKDAGDVIVR